jgi:serine/threonine protein kinase
VTYLVVCTAGVNKGILFALKIFRRLSKPERRESFLKEVEFLKKQDHPAVMRVFDEGMFRYHVDGTRNEYPFVVAEYLPQTLYHLIRAKTADVAQRVSIAAHLLSALSFLEQSNPQAVHRDIKPQNIFIKGRSCVLGDFGLMKLLDDEDEDDRMVLRRASVRACRSSIERRPRLLCQERGSAQRENGRVSTGPRPRRIVYRMEPREAARRE